MTRRGVGFADIPGADGSAFRDISDLPPSPVFIKAEVSALHRHGSLWVCAAAGNVALHNKRPGPLSLLVRPALWSNLVIEGSWDHDKALDPCDRTGATYGAFDFQDAVEVALAGGGRLLVDGRPITPATGRAVDLRSSREYLDPGVPTRIERVVSGVTEAGLVVESIGTYLSLTEHDAQVLAGAAMDFRVAPPPPPVE